jgi:hypothetical protein
MKPKKFYHLIIIVQTSLVFAKTYPNYGYYNPFPPKNQVLYNFSPLSQTHENNLYNNENESSKTERYGTVHDRRKNNKNTYNTYNTITNTNNKVSNRKSGKDRETRDLTWRQFDVYLRGDAEPSCAELRQMWNLARKLQKQASKGNNRESSNHQLSFHHHKSGKNTHLKKHGKSASKSDINSVATTDKKLAPTNNVDLVSGQNNLGVVLIQSNNDKDSVDLMSRKPLSPSEYNSTSSMHNHDINGTSSSSSSSSSNEEVYGVIKTHHHVPLSTPPTPAKSIPSSTSRYKTFHVRDPAKEVFGMFRQRSKSLRNRQRKQQKQNSRKHRYGKVHLETPNNHENKPSSYLDLLQRKLYGPPSKVDPSSNNEVYGVVQQYPTSSVGSQSSYQKVKELLAGQRGSLEYEDDLQLNPGESAFDRIRDRLMKTRARDKLNMPKSYLRRLRSRKRRQNVSIIYVYSNFF